MSTSTWEFKVEMKVAGYHRNYGYSYYHYIVESKLHLSIIEAFCKKVLKPAIPLEQYRREEKDESVYNHSRQYFTKYEILHKAPLSSNELNRVEYEVIRPSTD